MEQKIYYQNPSAYVGHNLKSYYDQTLEHWLDSFEE